MRVCVKGVSVEERDRPKRAVGCQSGELVDINLSFRLYRNTSPHTEIRQDGKHPHSASGIQRLSIAPRHRSSNGRRAERSAYRIINICLIDVQYQSTKLHGYACTRRDMDDDDSSHHIASFDRSHDAVQAGLLATGRENRSQECWAMQLRRASVGMLDVNGGFQAGSSAVRALGERAVSLQD